MANEAVLTAGVDIGGTKVFAALVEAGSMGRQVCVPTDPASGFQSIVAALDQLLAGPAGAAPRAIGVAAAAYVGYPSGRIAFSPNLRYGETDLVGALHERYGIPVAVENDANAAAWAESAFGAGMGAVDMIMLTVGTGIGGGAVLGGRLLRGQLGFAAEFGHMTLVDGGPVCSCGERGHLEALASGTAIGRMAREAIGSAPASPLLGLAGGVAERITGVLVSEAAEAGDAFAAGILAQAGRWLGAGLASLVNIFDPGLIVIGGGGAAAGAFLLEPARREMGSRLGGCRPSPPIVPATLGNHAGAIGAAALARLRMPGATGPASR